MKNRFKELKEASQTDLHAQIELKNMLSIMAMSEGKIEIGEIKQRMGYKPDLHKLL